MVVVDHFSKYVVFILMKVPCGVENIVEIFFKHVVKYWGMPLSNLSDLFLGEATRWCRDVDVL